MNVCEKHDCVVVYDDVLCPFCIAEGEITNLRSEIDALEEMSDSLNDDLQAALQEKDDLLEEVKR